MLGWQPVLGYPQTVSKLELMNQGKIYSSVVTEMISLRGPLTILSGPATGHLISLALYLAGMGGIFLIWQQAIKRGKQTYGFALDHTLHFTAYKLPRHVRPFYLRSPCPGASPSA